MKKTLLLCGLGLTVATSMVAGTMAIYTHTDIVLDAGDHVTGTAKKFYINSTMTTEVGNFKLAPTESVDWDFTVTNQHATNPEFKSEVDMDLVVKVSSVQIKNWTDLKVSLLIDGAEPKELIVSEADGIVFTQANAFKANEKKEANYTLRFTWDDKTGSLDNVGDTTLAFEKTTAELPTISDINVTVTGNQHVE